MRSLPLIKHTMAAIGGATARTLVKEMMRPHVPMIRFPKRELPRGSQSGHVVGNPNSLESLLANNVGSGSATSRYAGSTSKRPPIDSSELPARFQRKPISAEEMEFIEDTCQSFTPPPASPGT